VTGSERAIGLCSANTGISRDRTGFSEAAVQLWRRCLHQILCSI